MISVSEAILSICPEAKMLVANDDVDQIQWFYPGEKDRPCREDILAEQKRLCLEADNMAYRQDRAVNYPPIGDQLDDLFHAGIFSVEMQARIQAVKDRYPKP